MRDGNAAIAMAPALGAGDAIPQAQSIDSAISGAAQILRNAGIQTARLDARCLLGHILDTQPG